MREAITKNDPELAPPFDQVFGHLQRAYTAERVEKEVSQLLRTPRKAVVHNHNIVLRLSKDSRGLPFVVTTNFDHLFERAMPQIRRWFPPLLPPMTGDSTSSGVVYLHGRLGSARQTEGPSSGLILGSGDFGRAYLADGWATSFFRQLLERRVVVLLGYSAGDPPIRYLLEGLNESTSARLMPIYAFDRGDESDVRAKWRELGVTGIPFTDFKELWDSLEQWAVRADDVDGWRNKIVQTASSSPRYLKPYQRGQVAALAATPEGAKAFLTASIPPCAEWICVLDRQIRYRPPSRAIENNQTREVDFLEEYGLDDDPPRPTGQSSSNVGVDFLAKLPSDMDSNIFFRLAGNPATGRGALPRRLSHLSQWLENVAHEPAAIWWAIQQTNLHPDLIWSINRRLTGHGSPFEDHAQRVWTLLLEIEKERGNDVHDLGWFEFVALQKRAGWSSAIYRHFERTIRPSLKAENSTRFPLHIFDQTDVDSLEREFRFSIHCPSRHNHEADIPTEALPKVVMIVCAALERTIGLLEDVGRASEYFHLPAIEPSKGPGERYVSQGDCGELFLWSVELFRRLAKEVPEAALMAMSRWPKSDRYIFDKFHLFAWSIEGLVTAKVAAHGLLEMQDRSFWNSYLQRDLLHLMRGRWTEFTRVERQKIEARLRSPLELFPDDEPEEKKRRRMHQIGSRLGWLHLNGCELSGPAKKELAKVQASDGWSEAFAANADHDLDGRTGWVKLESNPRNLADLPASKIIDRARELSRHDHSQFVEHVPFDGLVERRPALALAAIAFKVRHKEFPIDFWRSLLSRWPKRAAVNTTIKCGLLLAELPVETHLELRHYSGKWIEEHLAPHACKKRSEFYKIWDSVYRALQMGGQAGTTSGLGQTTVGGQVVDLSRKTINHAINAPIGQLAEALFVSIQKQIWKKNEKLPKEIKTRLEIALDSVGEGSDHTASVLGQRLPWLFYVDRPWAIQTIIPLFDLADRHAEAAWNALLFTNRVPEPPELFGKIKPWFLGLFESRAEWLQQDRYERHAAGILIVATYWDNNRGRYVSDVECRRALQLMDDAGRQSALWTVQQIIKGDSEVWKTFGRRFFQSIWPQEARYQTGSTSDTMIRLAEDSPDQFSEIATLVKDYLRPVDYPDMYVFRLRTDKGKSLAARWPREVLEIADRIIELTPNNIPYELSALLTDIAEADAGARDTDAWRRLKDLVT